MSGLRNWRRNITARLSAFASGRALSPSSLSRRMASLALSPSSPVRRASRTAGNSLLCQVVFTILLYAPFSALYYFFRRSAHRNTSPIANQNATIIQFCVRTACTAAMPKNNANMAVFVPIFFIGPVYSGPLSLCFVVFLDDVGRKFARRQQPHHYPHPE